MSDPNQAPQRFSLREKIAAGVAAVALAVGVGSAVKGEQAADRTPTANAPAEVAPQLPQPTEAAPEAPAPQQPAPEVKVVTVEAEAPAPQVVEVTKVVKETVPAEKTDKESGDKKDDERTVTPKPGHNPDDDVIIGGKLPTTPTNPAGGEYPTGDYPAPGQVSTNPTTPEPGTTDGGGKGGNYEESVKRSVEVGRARFSNSFYADGERKLINGYMYLQAGSKDAQSTTEVPQYNIYTDLEVPVIVFGGHSTGEDDPNNPNDDLVTFAIPLANVHELEFAPLNAETPMGLGKTWGPINPQDDEGKWFTATSGVRFGIAHAEEVPRDTVYTANYENGDLAFAPRDPK